MGSLKYTVEKVWNKLLIIFILYKKNVLFAENLFLDVWLFFKKFYRSKIANDII